MGVEFTEGDDLLSDIIDNLSDKRAESVTVGIHGNEGSEVLTYAAAQEFGATINHPGGTAFGFKSKAGAERGEVRFLKAGTGFVSGVTKAHQITIPKRSFLRQTYDISKDEIEQTGIDLSVKVRDGKLTKKQALQIWGESYVNLIQERINSGSAFEKNAASTIRKKGGGKHPLQDSGRLQQSIKAVVE
jgi:hypothetical protein